MTTTIENRVPAGVPTGGQFAASARAEAEVTLGGDPASPTEIHPDTVFVMDAEAFADRFAPGEYERSGAGWDEVEDHPAFLEPNPLNPDRIHEGTWGDFLADVARNGIQEPVEIDPYDETVCEGHHRVVAALTMGQPVRFTVGVPHDDPRYPDSQALMRSLVEDGEATAEPVVHEVPASEFTAKFPPALWGGSWADLDALADEDVEEPVDEDEWEEMGAHFSWGGENGWTVDALADALAREPMHTPVEVVDGEVTDGHHRVVAALRVGAPIRYREI